MNLAALRCTISSWYMCFCRCGSQTRLAYFKCGLTSPRYACLLMLVGHVPMFRRRNPNDMFALLMIFWICVSQENVFVLYSEVWVITDGLQ